MAGGNFLIFRPLAPACQAVEAGAAEAEAAVLVSGDDATVETPAEAALRTEKERGGMEERHPRVNFARVARVSDGKNREAEGPVLGGGCEAVLGRVGRHHALAPELCLALAMGRHETLGAASGLQEFPGELLESIAERAGGWPALWRVPSVGEGVISLMGGGVPRQVHHNGDHLATCGRGS
jgi:hypothetical protein